MYNVHTVCQIFLLLRIAANYGPSDVFSQSFQISERSPSWLSLVPLGSQTVKLFDFFCLPFSTPLKLYPPPKTNMTTEAPPFEDVFPYILLKMEIFQCHVIFQGRHSSKHQEASK